MSLILCRQEPVTVPLYIEDLGIHLYSSQELCYVIYNNPLLVLEGFIDKSLQHQQRIVVDHIAELLGGVEMDPKILDIKRNRYRFLSAENQAHNVTS